MGDIAFNIFKDVNLNKQINLDINKDVFVNVDNPDQLATAEADAEAFGPFALAEVDAYTVVTPPEMNGDERDTLGGFVDFGGNTTDIVVRTDDTDTDGGFDQLAVNFNGDPDDGNPPDLDNVTAGGAIAFLDGIPPVNNVGLPNEPIDDADGALSFEDVNGDPLDLLLTQTSQAPTTDANTGNVTAQYTLDESLYINFGDRQPIEIDGDGMPSSGDLILVIPEGTFFTATYIGGPAATPVTDPIGQTINIDFQAFGDFDSDNLINGPFWIHQGGEVRPLQADEPLQQAGFEIPEGTFEIVEFDFEAQSVNLGDETGFPQGVGDWDFQATGEYFQLVPGVMDGGTAFAYAESTSALDLSQMMGPIAP